jgi:hypothetical protein
MQECSQCGGQKFRSLQMQPPGYALNKSHDIAGA